MTWWHLGIEGKGGNNSYVIIKSGGSLAPCLDVLPCHE